MVKLLDACETDFFGDLARDTHGVWEVFEFVRLHHPQLNEQQVLERGCDYITRWAQAGWIRISDAPLHPSTITSSAELIGFLRQHGLAATRYLENSPSIDVTKEAQRAHSSNI